MIAFALTLSVAFNVESILNSDRFREVRQVGGFTENSRNVLDQYGLGLLATQPDLRWDWVVVEGFELRSLWRRVDSTLFVGYAVEADRFDAETRRWEELSISSTPTPWEKTTDPKRHPPSWWPTIPAQFLTTVAAEGGHFSLVYSDASNASFYVFTDLSP